MSNLRKTTISNAQKQFLLRNILESKRLDGRTFEEFRNVDIQFGKDWGCCYVSLGKTRVLAQVSCELKIPKSTRPSEGILNINLELNTMADPNFETGRSSELSSQLNRLLEKCIKDSKAIDLESLCIKMNERVWAFRVDVNVINHEGNILDCASIAALAALAHFRRPDVTTDGIEFKIHTLKERDPIPTVIHHYPVCMSYALFCEGSHIIADPDYLEENVADGFLCIGLNGYKELCGLHLAGKAHIPVDKVLETTSKAAKRAGMVIEIIKRAVDMNNQQKLVQETGFHIFDTSETEVSLSELTICLDNWKTADGKKKKKKKAACQAATDNEQKGVIKDLGKNTAELLPDKKNEKWSAAKSDDEEQSGEVVYIQPPKGETVDITMSDSEEESVVTLN